MIQDKQTIEQILDEFDRDFGGTSEINLDTLQEEVKKHRKVRKWFQDKLITLSKTIRDEEREKK